MCPGHAGIVCDFICSNWDQSPFSRDRPSGVAGAVTVVSPDDTSNDAGSSGYQICKTKTLLAYCKSRLLEGFQVITLLLPVAKGRYVCFAIMSGASAYLRCIPALLALWQCRAWCSRKNLPANLPAQTGESGCSCMLSLCHHSSNCWLVSLVY